MLYHQDIVSKYHHASDLKSSGLHIEAENAFLEIITTTDFIDHEIIAGGHFHLGEIYLKNKNYTLAKKAFISAICFDPSHRKAYQYLAHCDSLKPLPHPFYLTIDVAGSCNLKCRFCPEGQNLNVQPKKVMKLNEFDKMIGPLIDKVKRIDFFNWSEPLLNPDLPNIIRYCLQKNKDLLIWLSTNGMLLTEKLSKLLLESGVHWLCISMSGLTNSIHQRYHIGSNIDCVLKNIYNLVQMKNKYNNDNFIICILYLEFEYNKISIQELYQTISSLIGTKKFRVFKVPGYLMGSTITTGYRTEINRKKLKYENIVYFKENCFRAFFNPAIRCDGAIFPCCAVHYDPDLILGDLQKESFENAWMSKQWIDFRKRFENGTNKTCNNCYLFYCNK